MSHSFVKTDHPLSKDLPDKTSELDESKQNLLRLCTLLVDINFRNRYNRSLDRDNTKGYSKNTIQSSLGSQITSVDDGFLGYVDGGYLHEPS